MSSRWLTWQPPSNATVSARPKKEPTKATIPDKITAARGSVSSGSGTSPRKSIIRFSSGVVGKVSNRERREATDRYLSEKHEPIELLPVCTCRDKPYPHDTHNDETALFEQHRSMRLG